MEKVQTQVYCYERRLKRATREYYKLLNKTRRDYHKQNIATANTKELFREIDKMTVAKPNQVLPTHQSKHRSKSEIAQKFSQFFEDKVLQLRTSFTSTPSVATKSTAGCHLENFIPISEMDMPKSSIQTRSNLVPLTLSLHLF